MKIRTGQLLGMVEEKVFNVGKREKTEVSGRVQTELKEENWGRTRGRGDGEETQEDQESK